MNYKLFKWVIDSLTKNFKCDACKWSINEDSIDIIWAAWNTVNLSITCPHCQKQSIVRAEIAWTYIWGIKDINFLKEKLIQILKWIWVNKNIKNNRDIKINDEEIINLSKTLKSDKISVKDILES